MAVEGRPCPFCKGTGIYHDAVQERPSELRWTLASDVTGSYVSLSGEITEAARLDRLHDLVRPVVFDLQGVRYMNTMGTQQLVRLLVSFGERVTAERCSPAIVRQLNLIPDLADHLNVISVMLPYECPSCHADYSIAAPVTGKRPVLAPRRCGTCDAPLELDEPLDRYLAFVPP